MEGNMKAILWVIIGAVIISALLQGLKVTALRSAADSATEMKYNDTIGVEHTVQASPINADLTGLIYSLAQGLVWLLAIVVILFKTFKTGGRS